MGCPRGELARARQGRLARRAGLALLRGLVPWTHACAGSSAGRQDCVADLDNVALNRGLVS